MSNVTPRLGLALIEPGQAQKEMTHNEALMMLDLVAQASVTELGRDAPPGSPGVGECWIVGDAPVGDWAGRAGAIAGWSAGGWRFVAPVEGMTIWDRANGVTARFWQGRWRRGVVPAWAIEVGGVQVVGPRQGAIAEPAGGSVIDVEARVAVGRIVAALSRHGLIG